MGASTSLPSAGLYVHVPFCVKKCDYCDFYSLSGREASRGPYVEAVIRQASTCAGRSFRTLYLGGGTPSYLGPQLLQKLMGNLRQVLDLSGLIEATFEANPDSATPDLLGAAVAAGFDRISIGVQSLSSTELLSVGRVHNPEQAVATVRNALNLGFRSVSADLIAGLPGQTKRSLTNSIETLVSEGIHHLSLYCLSVEEGTPLATSIPEDLPSDDEQADLFQEASDLLAKQGFSHYEISNFARSGHECNHNLNYWRGGEFLGLGPAAASHLDGIRSTTVRDLDSYLKASTREPESKEKLDITAKACEEAMLRLRLLEEGLDTIIMIDRYGMNATSELLQRLDRMAVEGKLQRRGSTYTLNPERVLTSNPIFAEVLST